MSEEEREVDQKEVIQLLGNWGYSPERFRKHVKMQGERAREIGEAVGATMYASMMALAKFAISGDAEYSVKKDMPATTLSKMKEDLGDEMTREIIDTIKKNNFSSGVVSAIYNQCSACSSLKEAELSLRSSVMESVAGLVIPKIAEIAGDTCNSIIECLVGIDHTAVSLRDKESYLKKIGEASKIMGSLTGYIMALSEDMEKCKNTGDEALDTIFDTIIGDIDEMRRNVSQDMLSIVDKPPSVWTDYAISFGKMMAGLMVSMSLGYVSYDDYESFAYKVKEVQNFFNQQNGEEDEQEKSVTPVLKSKKTLFGRN